LQTERETEREREREEWKKAKVTFFSKTHLEKRAKRLRWNLLFVCVFN